MLMSIKYDLSFNFDKSFDKPIKILSRILIVYTNNLLYNNGQYKQICEDRESNYTQSMNYSKSPQAILHIHIKSITRLYP